MPRMLARAGILAALLAPSFAFAAADDVTLTTDVVLTVNSITLNVSGSSAAIESMIVNPTNFSVTLLSGSSLEVTAPGREQLAVDNTDFATGSVCNDTTSKIGYVATQTMTVVVTPSTSLCTSAPATPTSGGSSNSSSSASSVTTIVPTTPVATTTSVTTTSTATTPTTVTTATVSASGLSTPQIQSIIDVLLSFNVDAATLASVKAALNGSTMGSVVSAAVSTFKESLTVGSLGSEVKALQEYLNAHGYIVATSGAGSPGNETMRFGAATKAALIKYQKAKGITPAVGYFGAKTRAAINSGS